MKKKLLLITCLLGVLGMSLANNNTNRDEITILANYANSCDRSSSISASINGHNLTINFLDDIGCVCIKIVDDNNVMLDVDFTETPSGYLYYIPLTGHYRIVIILSNDDEYEGEFDVTE